jgi:type I restriction enzyme, S subunit
MAEWKTEPLDQCLESLIDYRGKSPTKSRTGIPVLSAKVVKTTGLLRPIEQTIALDYYPQWMTRGLPRPGDVVMTTEAPMGEVIQLDEETSKFALGQRIVCMRGKAGKLDNTFLRYLLTSPGQQEILASYSTGTTVLGISQKALRSVPISYPDFDEQVIIGELLSALDDKIELNRWMNETLEASARTLFRDWFVDFGPTRANMAGAAPYLAPNLWSLFADALDDEGKPEGWGWGTLGDIIEIAPKEPLKSGAMAPYLEMAALPTAGANSQLPVDREYSSGTRFRNGDTLLARITPCLENGKTCYVQNLPHGAVGWGSTEFIVLRAKSPVPPVVSYLIARDEDFRRHAIRSMTGTSGRQRANADAIFGYCVAIPSEPTIWLKLAELLNPTFDQIASNERESRTLAETRDLLLPKLMSGEIRVAQAENLAGDRQ